VLPGDDGHEVALVIEDFTRVREILQELVALTGQPPAQAIKSLFEPPVILLGRLSGATARDLAERFAALGARLDISRPRESRYDLLIQTGSTAEGREAARLLEGLGVPAVRTDAGERASFMVQDLDMARAERLWRSVQELRLHGRVLNHAYQRFEVRLTGISGSDPAEVGAILHEACGIPRAKLELVLRRTPVVIARQLARAECLALLARLHACGASAEADLTASLGFDLEILRLGRPEASAQILRELAGRKPGDYQAVLSHGAGRVPGPFPYNQARWLVHELAAVDTRARLRKRT
jgi:hypothetical protein